MIIRTGGTSTVNWTSLKAELIRSAGVIRILILACFSLGILMTALHILSMHIHALMPVMHVSHVLHVILISVTFFLLAVYLYLSAGIASERHFRDLRMRLTVDPSVSYIRDLTTAEPVYNIFAGILAAKGIVVRSADTLRSVAFADSLFVAGNAPARSGYSRTLESLGRMGMTFSDREDGSPVRIALGPYEDNRDADAVITEDRIAHVLFLVFAARLFVRYKRSVQILFCAACAGAVCMAVLGLYTYIFAFFAVWSGFYILLVRRAEIVTAKPTFAGMESSRPLRIRRKTDQSST